MTEKIAADAKTMAKTEPRKTLILNLSDLSPICWIPAFPADRELYSRVMAECRYEPFGFMEEYFDRVFLRACAARDIVIVLDPDSSRFQPPSPAPAQGRGPRKSKSPKVAK